MSDYSNLEKCLDYQFRNKNLIIEALTHKSFKKPYNNERLEFLGDAVLNLIVGEYLYTNFPKSNEGELSKIRASLVNEKLKNFKKSKEIAQALEELNIDVSVEKVYFDTLIILNDPILSYEKRTELLFEIFKENKIIQRIFATFLIQSNREFFFSNIDMFDCEKLIDILWYQKKEDIDFDKIKNNQFLNELYSAKNYINSVSTSSDFDLNILILINKYQKDIKTNLTFEFICNSCKHSSPFYEARCPNCHSILSLEVKHHLTKAYELSNQSLQ